MRLSLSGSLCVFKTRSWVSLRAAEWYWASPTPLLLCYVLRCIRNTCAPTSRPAMNTSIVMQARGTKGPTPHSTYMGQRRMRNLAVKRYTIVVAHGYSLVSVTKIRPLCLDVEHPPANSWTWCETSHSDNIDCQNSAMTLDRYNSRTSAGQTHRSRADLIQVPGNHK